MRKKGTKWESWEGKGRKYWVERKTIKAPVKNTAAV